MNEGITTERGGFGILLWQAGAPKEGGCAAWEYVSAKMTDKRSRADEVLLAEANRDDFSPAR